jgi:O-methyltransferase involved in polyketide biosynthesis
LPCGAGLDTLAQRRPELSAHLRIYEVDQPGTQAWKRRRLVEVGLGLPDWLRLVPIDFETGESWWDGLTAAGLEPGRPAVGLEASARGARGSGTPFVSFYSAEEMVAMAREAGFGTVRHISSRSISDRYFSGRADGLRPSSGEELILTHTTSLPESEQ